ncbi:LacI family DNA-binding transcriptional regulator [Beutenbergia cavernae]|uniref:LacI family DNA-binding transcriptional regulator n=1 Tax=Beutenbergia cavernae TaxID=84757 RepID=UPI00019ACE0C|nr:LacI family DNA-binding transcriptional regulator [Beutenbergia cavernae]
MTLQDVAGAAGVSSASVSRVLRGSGYVSPEVEARVLRAVADTGYRPPKSPDHTDSDLIAVVVNDLGSGLLVDVIRGAERTATASELLTVVCTTSYSAEREIEILSMLANRQDIGAVIVVGGVRPTAEYARRMVDVERLLTNRGGVLVFAGRPPIDESVPQLVVEYENEGGAYSATSHLISRGHRRIALLPGMPGMTTGEQRLSGYRKAMAAAGVEIDEQLIVWSAGQDRAGGNGAVRELLARGHDFTAVFAGNDEMAAGALTVLRGAGLRVPDDVSLVGYDDSPLAVALSPSLTSVHLPHEELGTEAVRLATRRPGRGSGFERVVLGTHLVVRDSVAQL